MNGGLVEMRKEAHTTRCMVLVLNLMSGWEVFQITGGKRCADILQFSLTGMCVLQPRETIAESRMYRAYRFCGSVCSIFWLQ
jgi:hypothetical protein